MLHIYNTLAREKQKFVPINPKQVRMYVCGMTVYDYCHLGHARVMVVFDMVQRWLRASDYDVTYVRNITDIEDKIIKRAVENGESLRDLTDRFISAMNEDADALGSRHRLGAAARLQGQGVRPAPGEEADQLAEASTGAEHGRRSTAFDSGKTRGQRAVPMAISVSGAGKIRHEKQVKMGQMIRQIFGGLNQIERQTTIRRHFTTRSIGQCGSRRS